MYSTCTIDRTENEDMVRFLTEELGFLPDSLEKRLPERLLEQKNTISGLRKESGRSGTGLSDAEEKACIQLLPGYMEADGFFIARFMRPEE